MEPIEKLDFEEFPDTQVNLVDEEQMEFEFNILPTALNMRCLYVKQNEIIDRLNLLTKQMGLHEREEG